MSYDDMVCVISLFHMFVRPQLCNCQELFHTMVKIDGINNQTMLNIFVT